MSARREMTDRTIQTRQDMENLSFWENGLLPVVAQDVDTGQVLMVAFANRDALERTLDSGEMHYWSRSRQELWHKGATSGNVQSLVSLHADCDADTLLARVRPQGPACHTGEETCFGNLTSAAKESATDPATTQGVPTPPIRPDVTLPTLWAALEDRKEERPTDSYTVRLLDDENLRLKKLGEETAELITALARGEKDRIAEEGADLVYHLLAALLGSGVSLNALLQVLRSRRA